MRAISLASGSKGNSTYISSDDVNILVDIGLSCLNIEKRLKKIGVNPSNIDAILITHEHTDHCKGIGVFAKKYGTKVYFPQCGYDFLIGQLMGVNPKQIIPFTSSQFTIKNTTINAFELPHDSHFCYGYSIEKNGQKISIATDLGHTNYKIIQNLQNSDIVFLESNHDENLLINNPNYSASLKSRILSPRGHLSNINCAKTIEQLVYSGVKQVILAHLSEENNTPILAYNTIVDYLKSVGIIEGKHVFIDIAPQHDVGNLFEIRNTII